MTTASSIVRIGGAAVCALFLAACGSQASPNSVEPAGNSDDAQTLVVATSGQPKPYDFVDDTNTLQGYDVEILRAVDDLLPQYAFSFEVTEFDSIFPGLDSGRYQIASNNLSASAERREKYDFTDPYLRAQFGIIVPSNDPLDSITDFSQLTGKKAYASAGVNFTKILEKYNSDHEDSAVSLEYTDSDLQTQYKNLAAGSVDFSFNEKVVYNGYGKDAGLDLKFLPIDNGYLADEFGTDLDSAFAVSRQTPNEDVVLADINGALRQLGESGKLTEISQKYFEGEDFSVHAEDAQ